MKRTSRPPNIAVGSTIVFTPRALAALASSSAAPSSAGSLWRSGPSAATASSRNSTCSWIRVTPSSSASTAPCTVCTADIRLSLGWPFSAERLAPLGLLAQLALDHLPGRVPRQWLIANGDELRHLEVGELGPAVAYHLIDVQLISRGGHDHRTHLLAHHLVRHPDGRGLAHTGCARERVLDLDRVHVLPAPVDHVLLAIDDVDQPVLVDPREVTGPKPAIHERLRRGLRLVPVALHHVRPAHEQLTHERVGVGLVDRHVNHRHR